MRILFTCLPGFGHFHPLVPLAHALEGAGHEIAFATAGRFCHRVVEPAGFRAFPAGLSPLVVDEETRLLPEVASLTEADAWAFGAQMFARVAAPAKVSDLFGVVEEWRPDLVVHDAIDFAGPIAAAVAGIPWASHSFGALQPPEFWALAAELVTPTWRRWSVEADDCAGMFRHLYLDICPRSCQPGDVDALAARQPLRPVAFDTSASKTVPRWFSSLEPPVVYVTMGTIFNDTPGVFEAVLAGLGETPYQVVLTVGPDRDPEELGPAPANFHIERWIPQSLVFDRCDIVVCHAGSGTLLSALGQGVPLLLLPQGANQFLNAEGCVAAGAARMLMPGEVDGSAIRREVGLLLVDPTFRRAAAAVRREIEAMPAPAEVVPLLEALAAGAGVGASGMGRAASSAAGPTTGTRRPHGSSGADGLT